MKRGQRVIVIGRQVFAKEDQKGTIARVFEHSYKIHLDNGTKCYVTKEFVIAIVEHM